MAIQELDNLCMGCMSINKVGSVCPKCGFDNNAQQSSLVLPYRTILNKKFLIGKVLGKGGFGITYLAWDLVLQTAVAIKEYLPATLVTRDNNRPMVAAHSDENRLEFEFGLKQFLQEARTLAQFRHANVVRVREFFPANKTAYLVMDYYEGVSLQQFLQLKNQKLTEEEALKIMLPVMDGLAQVHQKGFLHRDIKPDNIYLVDKEHPVLLDFGAARSAISQKSVSVSVILTPGFAPFEQYLSRSNFTQSTDIYSVAATIYYMVSGIKPNEATARLQKDPIIHLANLETGLSQQFSNSIMKALAVYPENRPQSIKEFEQQLTEQPARTQTFKKSVYKPGYINPPVAPEPKAVKLDLAPMEDPFPQEKKYETYFCPHCKTKNVLREGKFLADAKCIKCRKTLGEKVKEPFSLALLFKISLVIPMLLLAYYFITHDILTEPFIKNMMLPYVAGSSDAPAKEHVPEPDLGVLANPVNPPRVQAQPAPIHAPASRPTMEAFPRLARPSPDGLPKFASLFAIKACEGKALHEECVANTPRRKLAGICEKIRGTMACIPGVPN
ncbi:MAG: serine/threonine-protein kinase [Methylovulum sp.]|uniref:serine/threonine protein kinase n=1 Tax=Methylovulum sp. TaxID=1916980 RepID=UPI00260BD789|nr:serine/threonine-protein kinase [Methylovulum sp.]MDD2722688.1 serine/threonine-protein kinase [Methylovulum sp.]MDD5124227.1 serine/threonine-protein kinase [Methylovulum sp.]